MHLRVINSYILGSLICLLGKFDCWPTTQNEANCPLQRAAERVVLADMKIIKSWTSTMSLLNIKSHCYSSLIVIKKKKSWLVWCQFKTDYLWQIIWAWVWFYYITTASHLFHLKLLGIQNVSKLLNWQW